MGGDADICGGDNQRFHFHANGTFTSDIDGQCLEANPPLNHSSKGDVQTAMCSRYPESNSQWDYSNTTGMIVLRSTPYCLTPRRDHALANTHDQAATSKVLQGISAAVENKEIFVEAATTEAAA
jgi:hypothetical protein